jgi:DNA-binding CsgD family transcriptional regulator
MDAERLARLTEQQRTCLRLVYEGLSSKAIAQRLGIEPGSVDQHLKGATRVLGVSGRHTAARLFADAEQAGAEGLPVQPRSRAAKDAFVRPQDVPQDAVADEPQPRPHAHPAPLPNGIALPLPVWGWKPHHLSWAQRLGWILAAAVGIALTFAALVAALEAIVRLVSR